MRRTTRQGFTLIELMVAAAILVTALGAFLTTFNSILKGANYSQGISLASRACLNKLEEMVARNFSDIRRMYAVYPNNTFDFNTSSVLGITGIGSINITDRRDLYGGGENLATLNATWSARGSHTSLVYDNQMWVMGGHPDFGYLNDVWNSTDGINWTQVTAVAGWLNRVESTSLVYDNKMWVIGGAGGATEAEVWYSANGANWIQATPNATWPGRSEHSSLVYDNQMWVIGGGIGGSGNYLRDVWYSTDGAKWAQATATANWAARRDHSSVVYDNKMWIMGGYNGSYLNDVWYSADGANWTQATASASWPARYDHTSLVYDNRMWVIGGKYRSVGFPLSHDVRDTWHSSGYDRILEVAITVSWRQPDGRIFGEDVNLDGIWNNTTEDPNNNGRYDSPAQLRVLLSEKNIVELRKIFLGRVE